MPSTSLAPPTFDLPSDNSNFEVWYLRAPAHLDISEVLDGVTLNVNTKLLEDASSPSSAAADTSSSNIASNTTLTKFKAKQDGKDYELSIGDSSEINHLRLLLPDNNDDDDDQNNKLKAHNTPFQRNIHLTSVPTSAQEELSLAPARETAPRPAFGEMAGVNGSVPSMRLAYVPVPQKEGLKRRWAMPGGGSGMTAAAVKRVKVDKEEGGEASATVNDATLSNSKSAKKKKKKEKKSKKTPKKK